MIDKLNVVKNAVIRYIKENPIECLIFAIGIGLFIFAM